MEIRENQLGEVIPLPNATIARLQARDEKRRAGNFSERGLGMFVKKSPDGNHAALHSVNPNPDPNYSCDGCTFLDGQEGEMHEGWGAGELERNIMALIEAKQN